MCILSRHKRHHPDTEMKSLDSAASKEITTEYAKAELSKDQSKKSYGNPKKKSYGNPIALESCSTPQTSQTPL